MMPINPRSRRNGDHAAPGVLQCDGRRAFASCQGPCKLAAVGGFVGSDLFNLWENAIKSAGAKYPNVSIVADQPGNYDPRVTLRIVQDALRAHPDLGLVISPWDDMTRGADQAITSVGKKPGSDVRIYSIGGTKDAVAHIKDGSYNETTVLLRGRRLIMAG